MLAKARVDVRILARDDIADRAPLYLVHLADRHEPALADYFPDSAADLVIAAEVREVGTQEYIAAVAIDPFRWPCFQRLRHAVTIRH